MPLRAQPVGPRDISWELEQPTFRVYLWRQGHLEDLPTGERPPGLRQADMGWYCSEWELTGGDVEDVLSWADEHVVGWVVAEVWVVVPGDEDGQGNGMGGHDP